MSCIYNEHAQQEAQQKLSNSRLIKQHNQNHPVNVQVIFDEAIALKLSLNISSAN